MGFFNKFKDDMESFPNKLFGIKKEEKEKKEIKTIDSGVNPIKTNVFEIQKSNASMEESYFWILNFLRNKSALNYQTVDKVSDVYSATETSAFFGNVEQRKGAQQEKVSTYLATIGRMVKDTFQIIRELKVIDERLSYYEDSEKGDETAEVSLKGMWVDLVEGGPESATSVLGLARKAQFVIIPDLFFKIKIDDESEIDKAIKDLKKQGINARVRDVLRRKLSQYIRWKKRTKGELDVRRNLLMKYLKQQYNTIKMYSKWVKPYLKNIQKLEMGESIEGSADLVTAFDTSQIELELLATKEDYQLETDMGFVERKFKNKIPCIRVKFKFVTIPELAFYKEYQRGAIHVGKIDIIIEGFVLSPEQLDAYKKNKEKEEFEILTTINESLEAIYDDMKGYLDELEKKEKEEPKKEEEGFFEPFKGILDGFKEIFTFKEEKKEGEEEKELTGYEKELEKKAAEGVKAHTYLLYDVYKKVHGMLSW